MNKRLIVLICILICCSFMAVVRRGLFFLYTVPSVNTKVFPFISNVIKPLNKALNDTVSECNKSGIEMRIVYKNAYGSGFLKGNPIPNDLDYSVGINLGHYNYDGTNAGEIAKDLVYKMNMFEIEFYNYIETILNSSFYPAVSTMDAVIETNTKANKNEQLLTSAIDKLPEKGDYVLDSIKTLPDKTAIYFPYNLKDNEVIVEDMPPLTLFSDEVRYSPKSRRFLREVSISLDYSFILTDVRKAKTKKIEIVSEAFDGARLQYSRRSFYPNVFSELDSENFIKSYNSNHDYLKSRLSQFESCMRRIDEERHARPVKMLKRYIQCYDLIYPALDEKSRADIYNTLYESLSNDNIILINDYGTIWDNLSKIIHSKLLFIRTLKSGKMTDTLLALNNCLLEMKNNNTISEQEYKKLEEIHKELVKKLYTIHSDDELLAAIKWFGDAKRTVIEPLELKHLEKNIKNQDKLNYYSDLFENIYKKAGFHKINLYWLNKDTIGIQRDDFTKNMSLSVLNDMAEKNNLIKVKYILINKNDIDTYRVRYSVWVRYKPSLDEEKSYQKLKYNLLQDKKNFKIKRRFVL